MHDMFQGYIQAAILQNNSSFVGQCIYVPWHDVLSPDSAYPVLHLHTGPPAAMALQPLGLLEALTWRVVVFWELSAQLASNIMSGEFIGGRAISGYRLSTHLL